MTKLRENGATSGVGVLATLAYDDLGRRTSLTRGNGAVTSYAFDAVSRLASLAENFTGTTNDQTATFAYNPASQIAGLSKTNDLYAWTGHGLGSIASVANGLNQLTSIGGAATAHDTKGNLTTDPTSGKTYTYSSENLLKTKTGGTAASLAYDPAMRLYQLTGAATTRFAYDGLDMIAEYNASNTLQRRFVHGPGIDEPLVQYEGTGTSNRRWLHADERGSIIATSDGGGNVLTINRYDEYGKPQATNAGRFQYTGQTWLSELGLYYYKARMYAPAMGRFLQTDPIGYDGGINLYAYVGNDPVNYVDPLGLEEVCYSYLLRPGYSYETASGSIVVVAARYEERCTNLPDPVDGVGVEGSERRSLGPNAKPERKCNSAQKWAERIGDNASGASALALNVGLGSHLGSGLAKKLGGRGIDIALKLGTRGAAGYLYGFAATSATVSLIAYAGSGQSTRAIWNKAVDLAVGQTLGRVAPGPLGKYVTDKITVETQKSFDTNRCAQ